MDELVQDDHLFICSTKYPSISRPLLLKLILFNKQLYEETMLYHKFAQDGSPWEFNLRDIFRSCQIIQGLISILFCSLYFLKKNLSKKIFVVQVAVILVNNACP